MPLGLGFCCGGRHNWGWHNGSSWCLCWRWYRCFQMKMWYQQYFDFMYRCFGWVVESKLCFHGPISLRYTSKSKASILIVRRAIRSSKNHVTEWLTVANPANPRQGLYQQYQKGWAMVAWRPHSLPIVNIDLAMSRGVKDYFPRKMGQFSGVYVSWGDGGPVVGSDFLKNHWNVKMEPNKGHFRERWNCEAVDVPPIIRRRFVGPLNPIGSMYGIYANIGGILMDPCYHIWQHHGSYGNYTLHDIHIYSTWPLVFSRRQPGGEVCQRSPEDRGVSGHLRQLE